MDQSVRPDRAAERRATGTPIPKAIEQDLARLKRRPKSQDDAVADLLELEDGLIELDDLMYPV